MARIIYSLGELAGSIAGLTFQRNSSGSIVRSKPLKNRKSTTKQQLAHARHQHWLYQWQQITQDNRDDWNEFASVHDKVNKFGTTKTLTGANWFESVNYMRSLMSLSQLNAPPTYEVASDAPAFTIAATADELAIVIDGEIDWETMSLIVWSTLPTTRSTVTVNQIRKYVTIQNEDPAGPLDITAAWANACGMDWNPTERFPDANVFVCVEVVNKASGITSPMLCDKINTSSLTSFDADYLAYIAEFETPPTEDRALLLNQLFIDLKAAGIFDLLDRMFLYASEERQQATISLKNPTSTPMEEINSGGNTFTASRGIACNGSTSYCDIHFIPSSDGVNYTRNKASFGFYCRTNASENSIDMGQVDGSNQSSYMTSRYGNGNAYSKTNTDLFSDVNVAVANSQGMYSGRRPDSNNISMNKNGSQIVTAALASQPLGTNSIFTGAMNYATDKFYSTKQLAMCYVGSSDIDDAEFYAIIQDYMTAIGAAV